MPAEYSPDPRGPATLAPCRPPCISPSASTSTSCTPTGATRPTSRASARTSASSGASCARSTRRTRGASPSAGTWDIENHYSLATVMPRHCPDLVEAIRRRVRENGDEVEVMSWNNGLVSAHTAAEFDAAISRAVSHGDGAGLRDLFGERRARGAAAGDDVHPRAPRAVPPARHRARSACTTAPCPSTRSARSSRRSRSSSGTTRCGSCTPDVRGEHDRCSRPSTTATSPITSRCARG